jgi:hypothetical protein
MMVFDQESVEPVMGIEVERISSSKAENKCFILVVLPRSVTIKIALVHYYISHEVIKL